MDLHACTILDLSGSRTLLRSAKYDCGPTLPLT